MYLRAASMTDVATAAYTHGQIRTSENPRLARKQAHLYTAADVGFSISSRWLNRTFVPTGTCVRIYVYTSYSKLDESIGHGISVIDVGARVPKTTYR